MAGRRGKNPMAMTEGVLGEVDGGSILEQLGATLLGQNQRHGFE